MDDIEAVCKRLILIDKGRKLFDGSLADFKERYEDGYMVRMEFSSVPQWTAESGFTLHNTKDNVWTVKVAKHIRPKDALTMLINRYDPEHISVHEQDIEDIVQKIFIA
jgi:ABC-2 type transport system ATP-binding protein